MGMHPWNWNLYMSKHCSYANALVQFWILSYLLVKYGRSFSIREHIQIIQFTVSNLHFYMHTFSIAFRLNGNGESFKIFFFFSLLKLAGKEREAITNILKLSVVVKVKFWRLYERICKWFVFVISLTYTFQSICYTSLLINRALGFVKRENKKVILCDIRILEKS